MKTKNRILVVAALFAAVILPAAFAQVSIPIEPVTINVPVTKTESVTLSSVSVQMIVFDLQNEQVSFRLANAAGGNGTLTVTGAEYQAIKKSFLAPFSAAIAPTLREKVSGE